MIEAYVQTSDSKIVGTIDSDSGEYKIIWRERARGQPGVVHTVDSAVYATFEDARQAALETGQNQGEQFRVVQLGYN